MTDAEMRQANRREELELLRLIERERNGGRIVRDHDQVRRVQTATSADQSLVASDSTETLTHAQALGRLRSESARSASRLRTGVRAKGRQSVHGGTQ